jgi:Xaa-Pro dipeptidase
MKRTLAIAIFLIGSIPAAAQPEGQKPKKGLPVEIEPNPYGGAPDDPYADPPAPAPAPARPVKPTRPAKATKPAKAAKPAAGAPTDPYADPVTSPPAPVPGPPPGPPTKPVVKEVIPTAIPARVGLTDLTAVQGLLAVQRIDGWLLFDRDGENPIASRLVAPEGHPTRAWFYLIPARGEPVALVHAAELRSFEHLPGKRLTYQGYRDLGKQLKVLLKGTRTVAVEYSAKAAVPSVSRVDAGTLELIRGAGVNVRSSDTLVQYTKAIWGDAGRTAHYVAVHHLVELRKDALAFIAKQVAAGAAITEYDVQQRLVRGMTMRGLIGTPPVVAAGYNTADPYYVPNAAKAAPIKRGTLLVISLAAKLDKPDGVWAAQTWVAVADSTVPDYAARAFETVSLARDQALALIADRSRKHRPVTGAEVDDATRAFFKKAGVADRVMHRTGHSIDNDLQGGGADLDNLEVRDTRILTPGTGFTVGPGLYFSGQFGVRSEVSVYLAPSGPEVSTPAQDDIELLLK